MSDVEHHIEVLSAESPPRGTGDVAGQTRRSSQRLTHDIIKELPLPERGRVIYWDTALKGFGVRVVAGGGRNFIFNYRVRGSGRQRQYTIGGFSSWSVGAARARAKELKRQVDVGHDPLADLADLGDQWENSLHERVAHKITSFIARGIEPQGFLYRHYGPDGDLLYAGQTKSPLGRNARHLRKADWRNFIYLILVEPFATREESLAAEDEAIRAEYPKHNKAGNKPRHPERELKRQVATAEKVGAAISAADQPNGTASEGD